MPKQKSFYEIGDMRSMKEFFICTSLARLKKPREIQEDYLKQYGKDISGQVIQHYQKTRREVIDKLKDRFLNSSLEVPIANERIRLERTEDLYRESQKIMSKEVKVEKGIMCLKEAREEMKGVKGDINMQFNQFNSMTDEQLLERKKELERKILLKRKDYSCLPNQDH